MNGVFPDIFKIARITPTFKSGEKRISLTIGQFQ